MSSPTSSTGPRRSLPEPPAHHDPEGKSSAAWIAAGICVVGFFLGSLALPLNLPWLFWLAVAIVIGGVITGRVLVGMGYGVGGDKWKPPAQH